MSVRFMLGDARECLRQLPERSVQVVPTSPPYWAYGGLRDYGIVPTPWADGWVGCLGAEPTPAQYVAHLVEVFREVRRVLRDDGVVWLNLGDCYTRPKGIPSGLKEKDLVGVPFEVAFALRADGWYLRAILPWLKRNVMPESVRDRPTAAVEYVFLLAKNPDYFYDAEAVKMPAVSIKGSGNKKRKSRKDEGHGRVSGPSDLGSSIPWEANGQRNFRNSDPFFMNMRAIVDGGEGLISDEAGNPLAFIVNPKPFKKAHFATWPPELVEPMIKAATSAHGACSACGVSGHSCACLAVRVPHVVLDPFSGSGTTQLVAQRLGRDAVYIDVKPEYLEMARQRVEDGA